MLLWNSEAHFSADLDSFELLGTVSVLFNLFKGKKLWAHESSQKLFTPVGTIKRLGLKVTSRKSQEFQIFETN